MPRVDKELVPLKAHYFLFNAGEDEASFSTVILF